MRVYVVHPGANFSTADVYTGAVAGLRALDGVDVYEGRLDTIMEWYELALAAGIAQGTMKAEAAKQINAQRWASAHITQHILQVWPDLVVVISGHNYHTQDVRDLRRIGLKVACVLTESPYMLDAEALLARQYDAVTTNERLAVPLLRATNPRATYLPHAFHPAIHTPHVPPDPAKACDVVFIGSMFEERKRLIESVDWSGITHTVRGYHLDGQTPDVVPNLEAADYYRSARICLNHHRTTTSHGSGQHINAHEAESLGPRAYEIAACGGFQLMDDSRPERFDVFGDCAPTYRAGDASDLERQVRYWLAHEERRAETARAMHQAVQPHSWIRRAGQLLEVLCG